MLTREILIDHGLKPMQDVLLLQTGGVPVRLAALDFGQRAGERSWPPSKPWRRCKRDIAYLEYDPPPYLSHPLIAKNELLGNEKAVAALAASSDAQGAFIFRPKAGGNSQRHPEVLRIDDRKVARETYEDEMRRYNPGGGFEQSNMKKVIDRASGYEKDGT